MYKRAFFSYKKGGEEGKGLLDGSRRLVIRRFLEFFGIGEKMLQKAKMPRGFRIFLGVLERCLGLFWEFSCF